jgi:Uma2 family endonuclease
MADPARNVEVTYEVATDDDRFVLNEENAPESALHDQIVRLIIEILLAWQARTKANAMVGRNIALRWNAASPRQGVDPDAYVVEPPPPEGIAVTSLCTWKPGHHPPRIAVEVVSESTAAKDYGDGPDRYAASGTKELWIFDPLGLGADARGGSHRLQVWHRAADGGFRRIYAGDGPARSEELGAFLVVVRDPAPLLRISDDADGTSLWPTAEETERAAKEAERAAKEAERAAKEAALAELERLRAELAAARGGGS